MRSTHLIGLLLWRGGLLLAGVAVVVETLRALLAFVDIPREIEYGVALVLGGFLLVLVSLILERIEDLRAERGAVE